MPDNISVSNEEFNKEFREQELKYQKKSHEMMNDIQEETTERALLSRNETEYYGSLLQEELTARNDFALQHAQSFQQGIEAESNKSRNKRKEQYEKNLIEHGSNVTMETAAMQRNLVRYQKDWKKEETTLNKGKEKDIQRTADTLDVSGDLFDITLIKGSKQHIDIKRIMRTCDVLEWFGKNNKIVEKLPLAQRIKIKAGLSALPALKEARDALLKSHALDKEGKIRQVHQGDDRESSNAGIADMISEQRMLTHTEAVENAIEEYKEALRQGFKQQQSDFKQNLQLDSTLQDTLETNVENKKKELSDACDRWKSDQTTVKDKYTDAENEDKEQLLNDTYHWKMELAKNEALIQEYRILLEEQEKNGNNIEAEKLSALLLIAEQSADYQEALHQSKRMERMVLGAFKGEPLTIAMRMELAERYHFRKFAINKVAPTTDAEIQAAVESAKNKSQNSTLSEKEMKNKGRREKRADRLQSFLGAKAIANLSEKELQEYGVDKETVDNLEERRINLMQLEKWLESDTEMKELKDSLKLKEEGEAEEESGWDKLGNKIEKGSFILDKLDRIVSIMDYEEQQRLIEELYKDSEFIKYLGMAGDAVTGLSDVLSVINIIKNIKEWKEQSVEDWIQTASDSISVGGDAVRLYFSYLSNLKNAADIADYIGSGIDILGGVTGMVVSGIKCGKSNARRVHTKDKIKELEEKKKNSTLVKDIGQLQKILGAAHTTAKIDMTDDIVNFATNTIRTATAITNVATGGGAEVAEVPIKLVMGIIEIGSKKIAEHRKANLRRNYVTSHYADLIGRIKKENQNANEFANLSDRDIEHTFLKFLGVKSGKHSEAGIRKIAKDSEYLMDHDHANGTNEENELDGYKKETLKSMSLEEKAERSDIMKMMGATEKQAANPIIESNRIYREQIKKGKSFSWFGRKWRKFKGMFSG